jgi:hypothetical protein
MFSCYIVSINTLTLMLQIIRQRDVKYIMTLRTITCVNHLKSGCIAIYISMHKLTCYK